MPRLAPLPDFRPSPRARRHGATLGAGLACVGALLVAGPARADASLTAADAEIGEGAYQLSIDVHGLTATVELRQTIVNLGKADTEAFYDFQLPADAVIDGLSVSVPGRPEEAAFGVDAAAASTPTTGAAAASQPDVALLERGLVAEPSDGDAVANYRLRIYPVPAGKAVSVRTHWVMPITYADGRVLIALPDRGDGANLSHESGQLRFRPLPGIVDYDDVRADGVLLVPAAGARAVPFGHGRRHGLAIEATPRFASAAPVAWFTTLPLDPGRGAIGLQLMVPRSTATEELPFDRVLAVVDTSRSMEGTMASASQVVEAVLAQARPAAEIDAIFFDRTARGGRQWRTNTAGTRAAITADLRAATLDNGTGLADAMSVAGAALGDHDDPHRRTLVVVITDGLVPSETSALDLIQRLGGVHVDTRLSFVLLAPSGALLPDPLHGPLSEAASSTGGMVIAARADETAARAKSMATELGQSAPLGELTAVGLDGVGGIALPDAIPAGQGVALLGWYLGRPPTAPRLLATRGAHPVQLDARAIAAPEFAAQALARASSATDDLTIIHGTSDSPETDADRTHVTNLIAGRQRRAGLVSDDNSLVVVDRGAPFAAERRKLAVAGGPFTRIAPAGEVSAARNARPPQVRIGVAMRRGDLDKQLIRSMLNTGLVPRARACFQPLLITPKASEGTIYLDLELSRGEVTRARAVPPSAFSLDIQRCVVEAAYQMQVPRVQPIEEPDVVTVVHYPLSFRSLAADEVILPGDADSPDPIDTGIHVDADTPLGGIPLPP